MIEVTSRGTWLEDEGNKKALCARLGVTEYYLYDPLAECLSPPLQGFGLKDGVYVPLRRGADGGFRSAALGLKLVLESGRLRLIDVASGEPLLRPEEVESARQRAEAGLRDAERRVKEETVARRAAEARAQAAEAELARLRGRARGADRAKRGRRDRGRT